MRFQGEDGDKDGANLTLKASEGEAREEGEDMVEVPLRTARDFPETTEPDGPAASIEEECDREAQQCTSSSPESQSTPSGTSETTTVVRSMWQHLLANQAAVPQLLVISIMMKLAAVCYGEQSDPPSYSVSCLLSVVFSGLFPAQVDN